MQSKYLVEKVSQEVVENLEAVPQKVTEEVTKNPSFLNLAPKILLNKRVWERVRKLRWQPDLSTPFQIPPQLTLLNDGENIVKFNFEINGKTNLGFSTVVQMEELSKSKIVSSDGTFLIAPKPFQQLYIINSFDGPYRFPCCFFLLTEKSTEVYRTMFRKLKELIYLNFNTTMAVKEYVTDFESGILPAVSLELPGTIQRGCFFHFNQSIIKKIKEKMLWPTYNNNQLFFTTVQILSSLAYLPSSEIEETFLLIQNQILPFLPEIQPILVYFKRQWLEKISPSVWSLYGRQVTTNNFSEGFNNKLKNRFGRRKHHIATFLIKMKIILSELKIDIARAKVNAERPAPEKKRNVQKRDAINECYSQISQTGRLLFLFNVAKIRAADRHQSCISESEFKYVYASPIESTFPSLPTSLPLLPSSFLFPSEVSSQSLLISTAPSQIVSSTSAPFSHSFEPYSSGYVPSLPFVSESFSVLPQSFAPRSPLEPLSFAEHNLTSALSPISNASLAFPIRNSNILSQSVSDSSLSFVETFSSPLFSSLLVSSSQTVVSSLPFDSLCSFYPQSNSPCHSVFSLIQFLKTCGRVKQSVIKKLKYLEKRPDKLNRSNNPYIIEYYLCTSNSCHFPKNKDEVKQFLRE